MIKGNKKMLVKKPNKRVKIKVKKNKQKRSKKINHRLKINNLKKIKK